VGKAILIRYLKLTFLITRGDVLAIAISAAKRR
jgi:hypothetical protein